ncbi:MULTISPECIES: GAF and ANTAR domain-containing protein [Mumia]|uniref:GAF and ANTAR domain-containing protein n=1 Tax=Mumia TaxID=1546255 RepID=UPI0014231618|nr:MULTISPECIES: GAF and ANTAR domain-containing protein [unclassified Mumia]QMW66988.1 GAF and ANTAR domain-containing protein [Mumia sp. ZJ1417]
MNDERLEQHEQLLEIVEELHTADSPQETAEQVIKYLCEILEMDHAAVTMIRGRGRLETVAATGDVAVKADELQIELGEGPCLSDSWDQTLRSGDLGEEKRWPRWASAVADLGHTSLLGVSLAPDNKRIGVVSLYSTERRFFDEDDAALAHMFARHAALAIAKAEHQANLGYALDARKLIGQAQGILMERFDLDDTRAFEVLRRYSQHHNLKLRTVAEMLVSTRTLPPIT